MNMTANYKIMTNETKLKADTMYHLGDFHFYLDEDTKELKVMVQKSKHRLTIEPNTDNSCTLVAAYWIK